MGGRLLRGAGFLRDWRVEGGRSEKGAESGTGLGGQVGLASAFGTPGRHHALKPSGSHFAPRIPFDLCSTLFTPLPTTASRQI